MSTTYVAMYTKCTECHLFVEENDVDGPNIAPYVHLSRGDEADEAIEATHDATPSDQTETLDYWRVNGPAEMRARFVNA